MRQTKERLLFQRSQAFFHPKTSAGPKPTLRPPPATMFLCHDFVDNCGTYPTQEDSEGPVQINNLDSVLEIPPHSRQEVVSPSQSAFGLRPYEDDGEDGEGEGEAPSEVEEDNFDDEGDEGDEGDDDWDAVSVLRIRLLRTFSTTTMSPSCRL